MWLCYCNVIILLVCKNIFRARIRKRSQCAGVECDGKPFCIKSWQTFSITVTFSIQKGYRAVCLIADIVVDNCLLLFLVLFWLIFGLFCCDSIFLWLQSGVAAMLVGFYADFFVIMRCISSSCWSCCLQMCVRRFSHYVKWMSSTVNYVVCTCECTECWDPINKKS